MDAIDEVKTRLNIEDVIGEYVSLKRVGHNFKGLSPFTNEKTPSFIVSPEKQIWKDFSSGKGGSMFDFVMEVEGLDFKEALELLTRKAGVDLEQYHSTTRRNGPDKNRLYELLELSAKFYQVQFSKNRGALSYILGERQFTKETALKWRLGYSPNNSTSLIDYAKSKGFNEREIVSAGLSSTYRGQTRDMFRGRLMVPLSDPSGQVIGFTARQLTSSSNNVPKYINTPQTVLYDKSRHVYGLHLAKEAIRKNNFAVIVEGNLDVIASHQAGVNQVVATAGTAITENQLKSLGRLSNDIRLSFDSDRAGEVATERAIPIASKVKVSLSIIDIPTGKDPDELIKKDPKLWTEAVTNHVYALDWLMARYEKLLDLSSAQGKREFSDQILPVINRLDDPVEKDHYLNQVAAKLQISVDALDQKLSGLKSPGQIVRRRIKAIPSVLPKAAIEYVRAQDKLLSLVLARQTLRDLLNNYLSPEMFPTKQGQSLFSYLKKHPDFKPGPIKLPELADYVKIEVLLYEELYRGLELNELHDEATRLRTDLVTKFVKNEKQKLSIAQRQAATERELRELQEKDRKFNQLLNEVKGETNA
jgi:DNA primase